jgi:hypothetical protein
MFACRGDRRGGQRRIEGIHSPQRRSKKEKEREGGGEDVGSYTILPNRSDGTPDHRGVFSLLRRDFPSPDRTEHRMDRKAIQHQVLERPIWGEAICDLESQISSKEVSKPLPEQGVLRVRG